MKKQNACDAVAEWNQQHPVGIEVVVKLDSGREIVTRTRSGACIVGSRACVFLVDIVGCYDLGRVEPLADVQAAEGKVA